MNNKLLDELAMGDVFSRVHSSRMTKQMHSLGLTNLYARYLEKRDIIAEILYIKPQFDIFDENAVLVFSINSVFNCPALGNVGKEYIEFLWELQTLFMSTVQKYCNKSMV